MKEIQTVYIPIKDKMSYFTVMEDFEYKTSVDEVKGIFFTKEEYNEHIANVIKQKLEFAIRYLRKSSYENYKILIQELEKQLEQL